MGGGNVILCMVLRSFVSVQPALFSVGSLIFGYGWGVHITWCIATVAVTGRFSRDYFYDEFLVVSRLCP